MECVRLLGLTEHEEDAQQRMDSELLLRFLTPLCKMYTAKCAVFCASEGIECLGGIGYLETTNMPRIWRDAQVLPVWEGTTNVLSMDVLRVMNHGQSGERTMDLYYQRMEGILGGIGRTRGDTARLKEQIGLLKEFMCRFGGNRKLCALYARDIAYSFCRVFAAAMLYEHAECSKRAEDMAVFRQFLNGDVQSSFVSGDCGKCLVSQSLVNLMKKNKCGEDDYEEKVKFVRSMGMGSYSKL